jgi:hypothetical protein
MNILFKKVEPFVVEKLDLDLDQVGFPTSLNELTRLDEEQSDAINERFLINQ